MAKSIRRGALEILTRTRLLEIAKEFGCEAGSNATRGDLVLILGRDKTVRLKDLLGRFSRSELKLACQNLALDETGREIATLIKRLVAADRKSRNDKAKAEASKRLARPTISGTRVSSKRGTSSFLDGAKKMAEPKIVAESQVAENQAEPTRVELVWPGKRREVDRVVLPFQSIEIVNESRATREADKSTLIRGLAGKEAIDTAQGWRNKLIWGDNKYVLGSLLEMYAGQVDLVYIDPPFATGADFSLQITVGGNSIEKESSIIEEKAYRDTWGKGLSSYAQMMYDRLTLIRGLLSERGSIYVHCDARVNSSLRAIMDEIFGQDRFVNEIVWKRSSNTSSIGKIWKRAHDYILFYTKSSDYDFFFQYKDLSDASLELYQKKDERGQYQLVPVLVSGKRTGTTGEVWKGIDPNVRGKAGMHWVTTPTKLEEYYKQGLIVFPEKEGGVPRLKYYLADNKGVVVSDLWDDAKLISSNSTESLNYPTQKPEALLERIIQSCTLEGQLVADFFCGSGTTLAVAEQLRRRWIGCDLSRWAIQVTRKRLLELEGCAPFEVLNLGKYERQYWQGTMFGKQGGQQKAIHDYIRFVLDLYHAEPTSGLAHIHGQRGGNMVHIGTADSPVTLSQIQEAIQECKMIKQTRLDILGWEWEMGLHDVIEGEAKKAGVKLKLLQIPRECMDQRAVDSGEVHFYELAYLEVESERRSGSRNLRIKLKNFVIPNPELIPDEVRSKIKKWSDFIDYWSVDFEFNEDVFHNQWQDYRTRSKRDLELVTDWHEYPKGGAYKVLVKVFDIFGNDTTQMLEVKL